MTIQAVEKQIVRLKTENPAMFANELREKLIEQEFCTRSNAPTVSSINRLLRSRGLNSAREERETDREKSSSPDVAKPTVLKHSIDNLLGLVDHNNKQHSITNGSITGTMTFSFSPPSPIAHTTIITTSLRPENGIP